MKAQISIEFMVILSASIILAIALFWFYGSAIVYQNPIEKIAATDICNRISGAINSALNGGDGYNIFITDLPMKITIYDYNISINQTITTPQLSRIQINWKDKFVSCWTMSRNVTSTTYGAFKPNQFSVTNLDNKIYVSYVNTDKRMYQREETINITGCEYYSGEVKIILNYPNGQNAWTTYQSTDVYGCFYYDERSVAGFYPVGYYNVTLVDRYIPELKAMTGFTVE